MNATATGVVSIACYLMAMGALFRTLDDDYLAGPVVWRKWTVLGLGTLAASLHGVTLLDMCDRAGQVNFNFLNSSSLASFCIVVLVLLVAVFKPLDKLGMIVFPLAALMVGLETFLPQEAHPLRSHGWQMDAHILVSMLAYSFLNIAALQAVLVALQDWSLHEHKSTALMRSLPPLQTMEKLLFQLLGAGFVLLSLSLLSGFLFLEDLFAQHLAHKTVLSMLAWLIFAVVLWGRIHRGWRGRVAIRWTFGGFAALMLAYFGSKIVLEWILHRT